ncbi:MAG: isochorismate synthase [Candidatus Hydrogenedentes bacterium]|nr:isochorismate synthase [Candidatus Hydrogenedentota bacterium]
MYKNHRAELAFELMESVLEMAGSGRVYSSQVIRRVEVAIPPLNLLGELSRVDKFGKYYWSSRDKYFEMVGWGEVDVITGDASMDFSYESVFHKLEEKLGSVSFGVKYYGGFKFNPLDSRGGRWKAFKSYRFVVPRLEIVRRGRNFFLCANLILGGPYDLVSQISSLVNYLRNWEVASEVDNADLDKVERLEFGERIDIPNFEEWQRLVFLALESISLGEFKKIVMSRETTFISHRELDAVKILSKIGAYCENAYTFCFYPVPERAFIGMSPECLFRVISTYLETEALAGTASKNRGEVGETKLSLLNSPKELYEHSVVVDAIRESLEPLTTRVEYDETPRIFELPNLYHLYTHFRGVLRGNVSRGQVLESLHPTPAIGGYPRDPALKWLRENEPIDRGVYSGPVGWVSYDSAEFCVGIRSALVQRNEISLYAGAGIVEGSTPDSEWNELEGKMGSFLDVISHSGK